MFGCRDSSASASSSASDCAATRQRCRSGSESACIASTSAVLSSALSVMSVRSNSSTLLANRLAIAWRAYGSERELRTQ